MKKYPFSLLFVLLALVGCDSNRIKMNGGQTNVEIPNTETLTCVARATSGAVAIGVEGDPAPVQFEVISYKNGLPASAIVVDSDFPDSASPLSGGQPNAPAFQISTTGTFQFRFYVQNPSIPGETGYCDASVEANQSVASAPRVSLQIGGSQSRYEIPHGSSAPMVWSAEDVNACKLFLNGVEVQTLSPSGAMNTPIHENLTNAPKDLSYMVSCSGSGGTQSATVILTVNPPPKPNLLFGEAGTTLVTAMDAPFDLAWTSEFASNCTISANGAATTYSGKTGAARVPGILVETTYEIACTDGVTIVKQSIQANIAAPTVTISASPKDAVAPGTPVTVSWNSVNATNCVVKAGETTTSHTDKSGSFEHTADADISFSATCEGTQGRSVTASVDLDVQCTAEVSTLKPAKKTSLNHSVACDGTIKVTNANDEVAVTIQRAGQHHILYLCNQYNTYLKALNFPTIRNSCLAPSTNSARLGFACDADTGVTLGTDVTYDDCRGLSNLNIPVKRGDVMTVWRGNNSSGITVTYTDSPTN